MRRLVDTDILIDVLNKLPEARAWFSGLPEAPFVPGLAVMELIQGCHHHREVQEVEEMIRFMPVV